MSSKWIIAPAPFLAGISTLILGFAYDLMFAGIPYQDPTPAMQRNYNFHSMVARIIEGCGLVLITLGLFWLVGFLICQFFSAKTITVKRKSE